jgi:hypothetical protein
VDWTTNADWTQYELSIFDEPIETAGLNISDELPVPFLGVKLGKPDPERGSFFVGKTRDGFFDLFQSGPGPASRFLTTEHTDHTEKDN